MKSKLLELFIIGILIFASLFFYGFGKAAYDVHNGLNMFTIANRVQSLNSVSSEGYRTYLIHFANLFDQHKKDKKQ